MIIVDTNLISCLFIPGDHTLTAERILRKDHDWQVPFLWRFEFRSVLVKHIKKGYMDLSKASTVIEKAQGFFKDKELLPTAELVIELSLKSGCSSYDCEFVVAAKNHSVPLVTFDSQILKAFPDIAVSPSQYLAM